MPGFIGLTCQHVDNISTNQQHFNKSTIFQQVNNISTSQQHFNTSATFQQVKRSTCYLMGSVPMYGGSPSFISKAMMPRDQMSTLCSCTFICICSYICVCVFVFWFYFIFVFVFVFLFIFLFVFVSCSFTRL